MAEKHKAPSYGLWIGLAIVVALFAGVLTLTKQDEAPEQYLTPRDSFSDAHGMAVDTADSSKLYIATHHGLMMLKGDKDLYHVGSGRDDYMGFSPHPNDPDTFFTSGHPAHGGNLGFQKTTDGGRTWQKLADGVNGPVDFHAMAVSQVDPEIIYGTNQSELQRSTDGGKNWQIIETSLPPVYILATDAKDESTVYAATADGLYTSKDRGGEWEAAAGLSNGAVKTLTSHPLRSQELLSYSDEHGFAKTTDGGRTWQKIEAGFTQPPVYLAYDPQNPETIYALLRDLAIYKTTDSGKSWNKVR